MLCKERPVAECGGACVCVGGAQVRSGHLRQAAAPQPGSACSCGAMHAAAAQRPQHHLGHHRRQQLLPLLTHAVLPIVPRYRVVAPDLRGHGETSTPDDADLSAEVCEAVA